MNRMQKEDMFRQAASWAEDREQARERSSRRAWLVVWILAAVAVAEALALIALVPLKSVVPYTILVDRQTGYATTIDPSQPARLSADQALTRSLLVQYVAAREGFDIGTVRGDYRKVMSWSSGIARATHARDMAATSPASPFARYPRSTVLEIRPRSVSELDSGSALVRFDIVRSDGEGRAWPPQPFAAVVHYRFVPRQMSVEERFINPLGFEVTRYRKDPEAAPSQPAVISPAASAGAEPPVLEQQP
jgi:type IV secretion system protein VirB8